MFIGEQVDGSVTEIESRDVNFMESEFPSKGEVDRNFHLYEIKDPDLDATPIQINEEREEILEPQLDSGSSVPSGSEPQDQPLRKSSRKSIPRYRFEIEGEAYLAIPYEAEPQNVA